MNFSAREPVAQLTLHRFGLLNFLRLETTSLQHIEEVGIPPRVELVGPVEFDAVIRKQTTQRPMYDRRTDLTLDVITDNWSPAARIDSASG